MYVGSKTTHFFIVPIIWNQLQNFQTQFKLIEIDNCIKHNELVLWLGDLFFKIFMTGCSYFFSIKKSHSIVRVFWSKNLLEHFWTSIAENVWVVSVEHFWIMSVEQFWAMRVEDFSVMIEEHFWVMIEEHFWVMNGEHCWTFLT